MRNAPEIIKLCNIFLSKISATKAGATLGLPQILIEKINVFVENRAGVLSNWHLLLLKHRKLKIRMKVRQFE